ncbi:MAG: EAL domain-containing protein [Sulfurimonas sp.]|nr:EAL domain-containing protein [Sulfurimonas sp.]
MLGRAYSLISYYRVKDDVLTQEQLDNWLKIYQTSILLTGLSWGLVYFIFDTLPMEYNFIIFAILIGSVSVGLLSLGIAPSVYYTLMLSVLGTTTVWMFLQTQFIYTVAGFISIFGMLFYALFVNKYFKNFHQILLDRELTKETIHQLEILDKKNLRLQERTDLALRGSNTSVLEWDYITQKSYVSPSWKEMLGLNSKSTINEYLIWRRIIHKDDFKRVLGEIQKVIQHQGDYFETVHRLRHKNGSYLSIIGKAQLFYDATGKVIRIIGTHRDITKESEIALENEIHKEQLDYQANHDELTGLANRKLLNARLELGLVKAKRYNTSIALLFLDLDHFKEINDTLGHDIGDDILKSVSHILHSITRKEDTVSRLGGDEFVILIENISNEEDASLLAQKIIDALDKPILIKENKLYISSSIGISIYPNDGTTSSDLLKYADSAMYKAKAEGRSNFQFYSAEMTALTLERLVMARDLRESIKNKDFIVLYQAQVDGATNKIIGMEALVRWEHPTRGMISPNNFMPIAESTGLMIEIDKYVMKTAMNQLSEWYEKGFNPGILALNLTIKQLEQKEFISQFKDLMEETNCNAKWIELEITEGQIMLNPQQNIETLKEIRDLGITLAIDDFGTGYSSLSYLKRLPINKLKIDKSFIKELPEDKEDSAIVKAIIVLAKNLNLEIIAEGVETEEQKKFILENKCVNIQGYLYSKPLSKDDFETLLKKGF